LWNRFLSDDFFHAIPRIDRIAQTGDMGGQDALLFRTVRILTDTGGSFLEGAQLDAVLAGPR